ncbi:tetratricopeptide repeat protein [Micromonospora sp. SH-82]|uniref:tetratricopeptide repeat protein n=1 Tax=Micromonospora sp. SH-82 TaxID=3132938 RepID=UPI003EC0FDA5
MSGFTPDEPTSEPPRPDPQLHRAAALLDLGRPEQALTELGRLPVQVAGTRVAYQLRATALTLLDRWDEVVTVARHGLAETGPDADLWGRLGLALRHRREYVESERALLAALALDPHSPWLLCQYADLCTAVGQTDKAGRLIARAAEQDPGAPTVFASRYQHAYATCDDRAAEQVAREFLAVWPEHPAALALHGAAAAERGRFRAAGNSFGQAVAQDPTDREFADAARAYRVYAHPLLVPLRPMVRLGVLRTWLIAVTVIVLLNLAGLTTAAWAVTVLWLLYCGYSWIVAVLVRRRMLR